MSISRIAVNHKIKANVADEFAHKTDIDFKVNLFMQIIIKSKSTLYFTQTTFCAVISSLKTNKPY